MVGVRWPRMPGCYRDIPLVTLDIAVCERLKSEPGRRSSSASTHANGTETNDSGKMACQMNAEME